MAENWGAAGQGAMAGAAAGAAFGPWGAAIGGLAGGVMGLMTPDDGSEDYKKAVAAIEAIGELNYDPADLTPDQLAAIQKYAPTMYQAVQQGDPSLIQEAPAARQAQDEALQQLAQRSRQRGLSLQEKANLEQANQNVQQQLRGQTQAIQENFRNRGMGGGAMEQAQILENQRAGANSASDQALKAAADAEARGLESLTQYGNMASQMRNQDFARESANTGIKNNFAMTKWQNLQNIANQNTQAQNEANQYNLNREDNRNVTNLNQSNTGKQWRTTAATNKYNAAVNKQKALADAYAGQGQRQDAESAAFTNSLNSALDTGAKGYAGYKDYKLDKAVAKKKYGLTDDDL